MRSFFQGGSSSSDSYSGSESDSDSESDSYSGSGSENSFDSSQGVSKDVLFTDRFIDQSIFSGISSATWIELQNIVNDYGVAIEFDESTSFLDDRFSSWLNVQLDHFDDVFDKARVGLLIRQYFYFRLEEYGLSNGELEKVSASVRSFFPVRLFHLDVTELGTVQVEYKGQVVGYFKPGVDRQQKDMLLVNLVRHLQESMPSTAKSPPLFAESFPAKFAFCDIELRSGVKLPAEDKFRISFCDSFGDYLEKVISVSVNSLGFHCMEGGMQKALPKWQPKKASSEHLLFMMSVVLVLGGRDLKPDGIKGHLTIIDFEDFLERKFNEFRKRHADLHIPFHRLFSGTIVTVGDWDQLLAEWHQVDIDHLVAFVKGQQYSHHESVPYKNKDANHCICSSVGDAREEYVVRSPQFSEGSLLSDEQIAYLKENLPRLCDAIKKCSAITDATLFDLIAHYDPLWAKEEFGYILVYAASDDSVLNEESRSSLASSFDEKDLEGISILKRSGVSPSDFTGLRVSPKPTRAVDPSIIEMVRRLNSSNGSSSDEEAHAKNEVDDTGNPDRALPPPTINCLIY